MLSPGYVAGFFDGEGTITIGLSMQTTKSGIRRPHHSLSVRFGHTNRAIIDRFQAQFGGYIGTYKAQPRKSQAWSWVLHSRNAIKFLRYIENDLVIKREDAALAFEFTSLIAEVGRSRKVGLTDEMIQRREALRCRLVALHGRSGVARFRPLADRERMAA